MSLSERLKRLNASRIEVVEEGRTVISVDRLKQEGGVGIKFYVQEVPGGFKNLIYSVSLNPGDVSYRTGDPIASWGTGTDCHNIQNAGFLDDRMPTGILSNAVAKLDQVPDAELTVVPLQSQSETA